MQKLPPANTLHILPNIKRGQCVGLPLGYVISVHKDRHNVEMYVGLSIIFVLPAGTALSVPSDIHRQAAEMKHFLVAVFTLLGKVN